MGQTGAVSEAAAAKALELSRMRAIATALLVLMAAVFLGTTLVVDEWPWLGPVRAFAEAAMVGACADWFAVTALFRRPLGLPIPHTGIIPRNKERIGAALGRFIADNFLAPEVLSAKLRQFELARWGGEWLAQPDQAAKLARRVAVELPGLMQMLPKNAARDMVGSVALSLAGAIPAAPAASKLLSAVWGQGRSQIVLDWGVQALADYLAKHQGDILIHVEVNSGRWMPKFIDRLIAGKVAKSLQTLLQEMRGPDHPWRQEIGQAIEAFIVQLERDPELGARAEALKQRLLQDPRVHEQAQAVWAGLEARLHSGDSEAIARQIEQLLVTFGNWLRANDAAQRRLSGWGRVLALRLIAPRRKEIGLFVSEVVSAWDTKSIVDRLELQVGADLQYIRINGTIVGGLVGLALYYVSQVLR